MIQRIVTSLVGLAVFFAVIFSHEYVLFAAAAVLIFAMLYEMYSVIGVGRFLRLTGYVSAAAVYAGFLMNKQLAAIYALLMLFLLAMIAMHGRVTAKKVMAVGFVTLFIASFVSLLMPLRINCGQYAVLLPFVIAWLTDTGAYFTGKTLGKHKLCPEISPKKTIEGAIGGIILAMLGCIAYIYITAPGNAPTAFTVLKFAFLGITGSAAAQLGDLIASCIKRDSNKKDYGSILPGHGGILDRFDSVLFVLPYVYGIFAYIIL